MTTDQREPRILVVLHLCEVGSWDEIRPDLANLDGFDLVVSTCMRANDLAAVRAEFPAARELASGVDGAAPAEFGAALGVVDLGVYDLVCRIIAGAEHRQSAHEAWQAGLRTLLRPDAPRQIWDTFRREPVIGAIVAESALDVLWAKPVALTKLREIGAGSGDSARTTLAATIEAAGYDVRVQGARAASRPGVDVGGRQVKLIAFYLPQFHPIPENDAWWGKGFTEWRQVVNARPLYDGHPQPRLPTDLGFYDLRVPEVRQAQADLASRYGIHGFCYYYYWFDGRRVLDRPLNDVLASGEPDFPFCICWANENWTRRWDGLDQDVLLEQNYSPEASRRFIRDVIPILGDNRYIRFDGKPVLIVYRAREITDVAGTLEIWRSECRAAGLGEIHVAAVRFWDVVDVGALGFDAAVDFPPHHVAVRNVKNEVRNLAPDFNGLIYDYEHVVTNNLASRGHGYVDPTHRGVMLAWDNTPRRGKAAHIAHGATPDLYGRWLRGVLDQEMEFNPAPESLVFINAWNEWAEGANLEPDTHFRDGFLEATRDALADVVSAGSHSKLALATR